MKVAGTAALDAPPEQVWAVMLDPAVLARSIPGCESLRATGPDHYQGTVTAGVASVKGTFQGEVRLTDLDRPRSLVLRASGAGAPGTVRAEVAVVLAEADDGRTELSYDADAVVGGMVGGVGQRVLAGVAKKMAGEFFARLGAELSGGGAVEAPGAGAPTAGAPAEAPAAEAPQEAALYRGRRTAATPESRQDFVRGAVFGAAVAFAGVLIGVLAGRRGAHQAEVRGADRR
ncbi:hypothetical protein CLV63_12712 [Murinocardiopsis flavida]|uniref:Carbon monoxide dehydrogenase subunit G n=1 Tax=Murinocardiopsis flavida TaxID=645275 RepID=A0A2P8CW27_9ACTN|nr:carbon monoxide dehydrogenase subunit G [Murinocardiopsis flavida]PSK89139.1 hypothetical protein CLV63_12712 [Murinocardiopsis flavida]